MAHCRHYRLHLEGMHQSEGSLVRFMILCRIRLVVDSILLDALSINATTLVLSFSHLAVGGAYLPATSSTHLLASIRVLMNGSVTIDVGEGGTGDVTVDAEGNSTVQVKATGS